MNLKDRLLHLAHKLSDGKATGKTTLLAKITQELNGILLVNTFEEVTHLQRKHKGLVVRSVNINLEGFSGPFFLDNHAASQLLVRAANKIEELEKQIKELKEDSNDAGAKKRFHSF